MHAISLERANSHSLSATRDLSDLASQEGHGFVERAVEEWENGLNRFDQAGETFFLARVGDLVVGVCGLNNDPYLDDSAIGRIRHLYVHPEYRNQGVGRRLVEACLARAEASFRCVRLRTHDPEANAFYDAIGFSRIADQTATHSILM